MRDVILIPWRDGDPWRERNLRFVLDWYRPLRLPVTFGDSDHQPFNRGASRNAAAALAGAWDVAVFVDADTLAELDIVRLAIARARETGQVILPHDDYHALTFGETERVLKGAAPQSICARKRSLMARTWAVSGVLVVPRAAWLKTGGYDPEFVGWGAEDTAFYHDAKRVVGAKRLPGMLWHLWHPRDVAAQTADFEANTPRLHAHGL